MSLITHKSRVELTEVCLCCAPGPGLNPGKPTATASQGALHPRTQPGSGGWGRREPAVASPWAEYPPDGLVAAW